MKSTNSPQDEEIIELLKSLGTLKAEYPAELLAARRAAFAVQIEQCRTAGASREEYLSQDRVIELLEGLRPVTAAYPPELLNARRAAFLAQIEERNKVEAEEFPSEAKVIELLGNLKSASAEYPSELLALRRAAFLTQIEQRNSVEEQAGSPSRDEVLELLGNLRSGSVEYPSELLAARRSAFVAQLRQHNMGVQQEVLPSQNGKVFKLFERLKSLEIEYPLKLWSARRSAFVAQMRDGRVSVLEALRAALRGILTNRNNPFTAGRGTSFSRTSMVLATLLAVVFMGSLAYGMQQPLTEIFGTTSSHAQAPQAFPQTAITSTGEVAKVICKPGYLPPLCLAKEFDKSRDLTFQGNGSARPAVAKDTIPGYTRIHRAAYVNDGLYGSGASWISNSAYSWIKIDLGEARTINTIAFGRDRLGNFNDGDPGQFIIAVALSDDVYADGNSRNDYMEYTQVYNSDKAGFDGIVSGPETIEARFDPVRARYVKITFENPRTAVDEIEVFMIQPAGFTSNPAQRQRSTLVPSTFTPIPTNTLVPSKTATIVPSRTPTLIPTNTPLPTYTATPWPTFTPRPTNTEEPTDTPEPPTDTPRPPPTDTPEPPTDTPRPPATDTSEPPTTTSQPMISNSDTPSVPTP